MKCLRGCSGTCDPTNVTNSLSCALGYQTIDGVCTKCGTGCKTCSGSTCSECSIGYKERKDGSGRRVCVKDCASPCATCSDDGKCLTCTIGYVPTLVNGKCLVDLSCSTPTAPKCNYWCPSGSYSSGESTCARCPEHCFTYEGQSCTTCFEGFYYFKNSSEENPIGRCIACSP